MSDPLATYLHDHLAGSHFAVNLLESMADQYADEELGRFALELSAEIKQDQGTLEEIIDRVGRRSIDLTEATGWLAEKASKLKLQRDDSNGGIGTFEALETLTLGIRGKLALWRVLPVVREMDARIPDKDFEELAARARHQYARVERQRLEMARETFALAAK